MNHMLRGCSPAYNVSSEQGVQLSFAQVGIEMENECVKICTALALANSKFEWNVNIGTRDLKRPASFPAVDSIVGKGLVVVGIHPEVIRRIKAVGAPIKPTASIISRVRSRL